jgi:transcription elongation factor GreA
MNSAPAYVSKEGLEKLKEELHHLKTVRRREVADRIEKAKDLGDLKENADYHDAKDESGWIEARVRELEDMINRATIIEARDSDNVIIGCKVRLQSDAGKEKLFTIVGAAEANPVEGRISNDSPLGHALLGKRIGETAEVKTPAGVIVYTVKEISC